MDQKEYEDLKAKFLKVVADVPIPLREEIIAMVDNKGVSWNVAYGEVKNDTKNSKDLLKHLTQIGLL